MPKLYFDVYCGTCGNGCCNDTEVRGDSVTVICNKCVQEKEDLEAEIESLKDIISDLKADIDR